MEAARTKFAADGADKAAADRKNALGMMSRQEWPDGGKRLSGGGGGIYGSQPGFNGSHGGI